MRVCVVLAAVALSACGGGDTMTKEEGKGERPAAERESGAKTVDPCGFISPAEVSAITGNPVKRASASGDSCKYHQDPDDGAETTVHLTGGIKKMEAARGSMKLLGGIGKQVANKGGAGADTGALLTAKADSPGIGDESLWGINGTIYARKGDAYVEAMAPLMRDPARAEGIPLIKPAERRAIAQAIAERILKNIEESGR